ncbi:hypothetical protein [Aeromonas salmonicida]|uniref:hypothetical protein n=1 Tax=Aeromonas salmonicida TaxID=645 RepID=UPI003D222858
MAKEWLEVVDTAIKIGLGALITGGFTYLGIKKNHQSERSKFIREHKIKILEEVSSDLDKYFHSLLRVISIVAGAAKGMDHGLTDVILNKQQLEDIKTRDKELVGSVHLRNSASSKLRLLRANEAINIINNVVALETELRNRIVFEKKHYNYKDISAFRSEVYLAKNKFHDELANIYDNVIQ